MRAAARLLPAFLILVLFAAWQASSLSFAAEPSANAPAPVLIEAAVESGALPSDVGNLYLAYALFAPAQLPAEFRSEKPFHGTVWLLKLRRALATMSATPERAAIAKFLGDRPTDVGTSVCELSPVPSTDVLETAHYRIEYNAAEVNNNTDGLTSADYAASLETAWGTEVDAFGWAAPPRLSPDPIPGGKYLVKVQNLGPVLYGYVSNFGTGAGRVGDNPNTPWNDQDADASCMGLNSDYSGFPGTPGRALDATTAHEFNHSLQFGYGGLNGANEPDSVYVEGGATWMEDEVFDYANDNYNYLWPEFDNDMGEYEDSPYPYWITFRGLTERYGAGVPGGGENVMQTFWELTSRNAASNLQALDRALRTRGTNLAPAYHAYAIAVKFNRACGGGYVYPYCFEEGPQYVSGDGVQDGAGPTQPHGTIAAVPGPFSGMVPDNYALNWVVLPAQRATYRLTFTNTSRGGLFRVTAACDTGSALRLTALPGQAGPGQTIEVSIKKANVCEQIVAVITNVAQTDANPAESAARSYTVSTATAGP